MTLRVIAFIDLVGNTLVADDVVIVCIPKVELAWMENKKSKNPRFTRFPTKKEKIVAKTPNFHTIYHTTGFCWSQQLSNEKEKGKTSK
jgi:hypothetical protein